MVWTFSSDHLWLFFPRHLFSFFMTPQPLKIGSLFLSYRLIKPQFCAPQFRPTLFGYVFISKVFEWFVNSWMSGYLLFNSCLSVYRLMKKVENVYFMQLCDRMGKGFDCFGIVTALLIHSICWSLFYGLYWKFVNFCKIESYVPNFFLSPAFAEKKTLTFDAVDLRHGVCFFCLRFSVAIFGV